MSDNIKTNALIVALDLPTAAEARKLVKTIGHKVSFFKIGLELFASGAGIPLCKQLCAEGYDVFADFKLFDIPATVGRATAKIAETGAKFVSVHGQDAALSAAVDNAKDTGVLSVTALTSFDESDMRDLGLNGDVQSLVVARARRAHELGCTGVVCSPLEVAAVRAATGETTVVIAPGIRPAGHYGDCQKRTASVTQALQAGASHVVVGRAVRDAHDPSAAVDSFLNEIEQHQRSNAKFCPARPQRPVARQPRSSALKSPGSQDSC